MRNRKDNYPFGRSDKGFFIDNPQAVAQACVTRLRLWRSEWFADLREGTGWNEHILGTAGNSGNARAEIQTRIAETEGVKRIASLSISRSSARALRIQCTIDTAYGLATINTQV